MKKNKENKNISPPKSKSLDICMNCASKYCPGSKNPICQKKSNVTPKTSKTSIGAKTSKMNSTNKCNCTSYIDHVAMLDMVKQDTCSCGIFAQALRSNIHMNIGTLLHRDECSHCTEEAVEKVAVEKD